MTSNGRARRWLVAGGVAGLIATPRLTRLARDLVGRAGGDPEAPFRGAPCQSDPAKRGG